MNVQGNPGRAESKPAALTNRQRKLLTEFSFYPQMGCSWRCHFEGFSLGSIQVSRKAPIPRMPIKWVVVTKAQSANLSRKTTRGGRERAKTIMSLQAVVGKPPDANNAPLDNGADKEVQPMKKPPHVAVLLSRG